MLVASGEHRAAAPTFIPDGPGPRLKQAAQGEGEVAAGAAAGLGIAAGAARRVRAGPWGGWGLAIAVARPISIATSYARTARGGPCQSRRRGASTSDDLLAPSRPLDEVVNRFDRLTIELHGALVIDLDEDVVILEIVKRAQTAPEPLRRRGPLLKAWGFPASCTGPWSR